MAQKEGRIPLSCGHSVWYRIVGDGGGTPLLLLHGGPGGGHDYLEPLEALAEHRPVIFYDQLGCGKSDQPDDPSLWTMARFVSEVDEVRAALDLDTTHILGQSWGGWLGVEYLLQQPKGLKSMILANTSASMRQFGEEAWRLIDAMPANLRDTIRKYDQLGDYHHPDYEAAVEEFLKLHACRLDPFPECLMRTVENLHDNQVYNTMNGPNEFTHIGNLKDWDRTERLGEIRVPTLVLVGRFDELTPACAETLHQGIAGSELVLFEESSHTPHLEETEKYLEVVNDFLGRNDG
jgi:proline-specific peptidase